MLTLLDAFLSLEIRGCVPLIPNENENNIFSKRFLTDITHEVDYCFKDLKRHGVKYLLTFNLIDVIEKVHFYLDALNCVSKNNLTHLTINGSNEVIQI